MRPGSLPIRAQPRPVCLLCSCISRQPASRRSFLTAVPAFAAPALRRQTAKQHAILARLPLRSAATAANTRGPQARAPPLIVTSEQWAERVASLNTKLAEVEQHIARMKASDKVEPESVTLEALQGLGEVAQQVIAIRSRKPPPPKVEIKQSSAGAILSMGREEDDPPIAQERAPKPKSSNEIPSTQYISNLALDLLRHPTVFISASILAAYVHLQRLVRIPRAIPEVFYLYANKPVPVLGSSPPKFSTPSPQAAKQAIPIDLADQALTAAIEAKDMPLALRVVETTYDAPAWRRRRIYTKLGLPGAIAALMPLLIYMIAQESAVYSGFIEPRLFKLYTFLGFSAYALSTGTIGYVALTTYNDHFNRVVWRPGTQLTERYLREDERAGLDRIATAWGFKEDWRRGDEEGEEWEGLREYLSLKDMILDKPDLMPGMNA